MEKDVPLVIAGVNDDDLKWHKGIVANPNCSTSQLMLVLKPLHDYAKIKQMFVSTYQAVSGAGLAAINELKESTVAKNKGEDFEPKAFKKNSGLILLICLMNAILYTFVYIVFNALSLPTLAIIGVLIILIFNMLSFKYISYRSLENHPITINDYYFSLRNTLNSFRLGNFTLITGILWGTLGYLIFGGVASIGYIGYLSIFNSSSLTPLISAINTTDANNILEALNKLPYIDIILDTTSLLSILGFAIFFLLKGMSKIFIFYNTFDLHLPLPAAIGISELLVKQANLIKEQEPLKERFNLEIQNFTFIES